MQDNKVHLPAPSLNGGLYTGTPFASNAPWRNYPVPPDAGFYNFGSLRETSAPLAARYMVPGGGLRPGNNTPLLPADYLDNRIVELNAICVPPSAYADTVAATAANPFRKYAYIHKA